MANHDIVLESTGQFEKYRDPTRLAIGLGIAVVLLLLATLAWVNYDAIAESASNYTGRRAALRDLVAPAAVGIPLLLAVLAATEVWGTSMQWRDPGTGERLKLKITGPVFQVAAEAGQVHQRFATGDPRVYLPVNFGKNGQVGLAVHTLPKQQRAFVSVTEGYGKKAKPLPLITLEGNAAVALDAVESQEWAQKAHKVVLEKYLGGAAG
ncbi:hypothetical protein ACQCX5_02455 [Propionibacteriaceae bacterium G57]|uniref:hypothetical protein n=1 Tax=Aestuariimicrobium sp. G57 TaxID=3418485 RepID=UPI003DA73B12